ncbi:sigma factor [Streptomyces sp. NPDC001443]
MLGSFHEAEDLAQETLLRARKTRDRYAPARPSTRTWPYRIATDVCLIALEGRGRRPLPSGLGAFPDQRFDMDLELRTKVGPGGRRPARAPPEGGPPAALPEGPGSSATRTFRRLAIARTGHRPLIGPHFCSELLRADLWLIWVTAVHCPPARQCAVLVLREVLEVSAADAMFMDRVFRMRGPGWRTRELTANGQPALAAYAPRPDGGHQLHTLQVFTVTGGRVAHNVVFADPRVLGAFDLPYEISVDLFRRER